MEKEKILEKIDLAFHAIGSYESSDIVKVAWRRKHCRCDPDVGHEPCEYCAIYDALIKSYHYIRSN